MKTLAKPHVTRIDTAVIRSVNVISVHPLDCCLQSFSVFPSFGFYYNTVGFFFNISIL